VATLPSPIFQLGKLRHKEIVKVAPGYKDQSCTETLPFLAPQVLVSQGFPRIEVWESSCEGRMRTFSPESDNTHLRQKALKQAFYMFWVL